MRRTRFFGFDSAKVSGFTTFQVCSKSQVYTIGTGTGRFYSRSQVYTIGTGTGRFYSKSQVYTTGTLQVARVIARYCFTGVPVDFTEKILTAILNKFTGR